MGLGQGLQTADRQAGIGLSSDTDDPEGCDRDGKPEPFRTLWIHHLGLVPLPASSLGIFKAAFNGTITNDKCDTRLHDLSEAKAFRQVSMPVPNPSLRHW